MPKDTKTLGNNKARAWESLGFAHKKRLCQHFDTTSICSTMYANVVLDSFIFQFCITPMAFFVIFTVCYCWLLAGVG